MKLFVVSDIHGYAGLLKEALDGAGYSPDDENQLLICCGDCFDRGEENFEVLKFFERIERKVMVKGNHDERLFEILNTGRLGQHDFTNGTVGTIEEFFGKYAVMSPLEPVDFSGKTGTVDRLCDFLGEMKDYYETKRYVFVHGWLPNENNTIISNWRQASPKQWTAGRWTWWIKGCNMPGRTEKKTVVCGHYPLHDSEIFCCDSFIAIDAGTHTSKKLNVLVLEDELLSVPN